MGGSLGWFHVQQNPDWGDEQQMPRPGWGHTLAGTWSSCLGKESYFQLRETGSESGPEEACQTLGTLGEIDERLDGRTGHA